MPAAPSFADAVALHQAGHLDEAEAAYRALLAGDPAHADSLHHLGLIAVQRGDLAAAADLVGRAAALDPTRAEVHYNLGTIHARAGRPAEAAACFAAATGRHPGYFEAWYNLGMASRDLGRFEAAVQAFAAALTLRPQAAEAWNAVGNALERLDRLDEAASAYGSALALRPDDARARYNLGNVLAQQGRPAEAAEAFRAALAAEPGLAEAWNNLGAALKALHRFDEAVACYRTALSLRPDDPEAHWNLAIALLTRGDFAEGWREYEWRRRGAVPALAARPMPMPEWQGEDPRGRTLLLTAEQGLGDTLQFCRYAPVLAERGARVVLQVHPPLVTLLSGLDGVAEVVPFGAPVPAADRHCPLMSLPHRLGTTLETIPAVIPYLRADPQAAAAWRRRLAALPGLRVGLVWAGNPRPDDPKANRIDRRRSLPPERLLPLAALPGLSLVSLQKGGEPAPAALGLTDWMDEVEDFAATAALVEGLDLVVSVDTAVAHLAGALGRPVWILSRFDSCWRWLQGRDDSPWYPTVRLFRQDAPGEWDTLVVRLAAALESALSSRAL